MADLIAQGVLLASGDPNSVTPTAKTVKVPLLGRGWAYLHTKIAAHASDTATFTVQGRLNSSGAFVALKKQDHSTACSVAQSAGGASETITTVELMPEMKVVFSDTGTAGASVKVWLEAIVSGSRADS